MDAWRLTLTHWLHGIRFYIALSIILVSLNVWWWAATSFGGSSLFSIRLEEVYAWIAIGCLGVALSIGPLFRVFKELPGRNMAYDSRRLFGIGAAWFSTLHITVAYLSLFKLANPLSLPGDYRRSFLIGGIAWVILLAMAFTSFNAAMRTLGPWWFRLHRFVYVAVGLAVLHAFTIGTHASRLPVVGSLAVVALSILGLHCYAVVKQGKPASNWQLATIGTMAALLMIIFSYGYDHRSQYQATADSPQGGTSAKAY
jgi:sulfoxide reductase heme-binding subunit YedZ